VGDVSVCLYCNHVSIFNADLSVRDPTPSEWDELFNNPDFMRTTSANAKRMKMEERFAEKAMKFAERYGRNKK
jgi:hypothetical protein